MSEQKEPRSNSERWAEFRFSVVGPLLSAPPAKGELGKAVRSLAERTWRHPISGTPVRYSTSTIERWYYRCAKERHSPVKVLHRKVRDDKGGSRSLSQEAKDFIRRQYREHPSWSYKLHTDNLQVELEKDCPSYATIRRYMKGAGFFKEKRSRNKNRAGTSRARERLESREVRSFEIEYVGGLWHLDFHHCSRQILTKDGRWKTPICLAVLDDHSRLACHVQWYLSEDTRHLVHGFSQAIQKRGLPRSLITDNGSAMLSEEFTQGLLQLGIVHETTLPYSPYQNGKQERFFGVLEGRLIAMLEGCKELTLRELNNFTLAWMEMEYNRAVHEEIKTTPLDRYVKGKDVSRESPSSKELRLTFRKEALRKQRRTDGTVSIDGVRFEVPPQYRSLEQIRVRYARWDLAEVHLIHPDTGSVLSNLYPLDKARNASSKRRATGQQSSFAENQEKKSDVAPLLKKLIADYAKTGLPPAYVPEDEDQ